MFAAGAGLFVLGYALIWTGVHRFRGGKATLLDSLGFSGGKTTSQVGSGGGTTPSSDTSPSSTPTATPAVSTSNHAVTPSNANQTPAGSGSGTAV